MVHAILDPDERDIIGSTVDERSCSHVSRRHNKHVDGAKNVVDTVKVAALVQIEMTYSPDTANAMSGVSFGVYENPKLFCSCG